MTYKSLLSCSNNTRELGGIVTADGFTTKNNVYWRSDVPENPSDTDIERLLSAHITTVIDMRTDAERKRTPNALADMDEFEYYHFQITEGSGVPESLEAVPQSYLAIAVAEKMPKVMKVISEAENGVIFHCTAGKDRTGVVSAIILMSCGVDREEIVRDYVISREYNHKRLETFLAAHPEVDRNIVLANEKSINGFIDLFKERFDSSERYFEYIGLSAENANMIRNKLKGK
ncbi:tyrosine-protein phosphatase [Ruminococcus sp.]|uniref:tyrosine-protein phosphatase n=1 Tax=Ruminococcus sp. TaxID=41978 RepID=UPI0025F6C320|nr:tyrosine-protein phosphatase [Ruminococcus sp.]